MDPELVKAMNRIAAALERLADAYLYCNDHEEELDLRNLDSAPSVTLPADFKGMR